MRRVVSIAKVEDAAGCPLGACVRRIRNAKRSGGGHAVRFGLDHTGTREAVNERDGWARGLANVCIRRVVGVGGRVR